MCRAFRLFATALLLVALGGEAGAQDRHPLLGDWCTDFGYRIKVRERAVAFEDDRRSEDPPPAYDIRFAAESVSYVQDFRATILPQIDIVACTLRRVGADRAEESCAGPGSGFMEWVPLRRCLPVPMS